ncbi:MAG: Spi family protease inhibitor [Paludibacteraceae bacterium]|nr:Spi family protease inhibitor [Paludibacteraceae bacterium]
MNKSVFLPATRASFLLACCAFFSGCEDDSFKEDFEAQQNNSPSYSVGRESAKKEALNAVKAFFSQSSTREIGSVDALLSDAGSSDTLAYVCNFKGDAGFAIVVADERVKDKVIACTDQGSFDGNSDNPGFTFLLNNIMLPC